MQISGYEIGTLLFESAQHQIFRGRRSDDGTPIILKIPRAEFPSLREAARLRREYEVTNSLNIHGVVRCRDIVSPDVRPILIFDDLGGAALTELLRTQSMSLAMFLDYAIRLSEVLNELHARGIVHKDVKPRNIIVRESGDLFLTDFGICSELSREGSTPRGPDRLEGTLAYMSPEQTGRMNRVVDSRSDLYSAGMTFYEMLCGKPPFALSDPMEIIHSHVAVRPAPVRELRPDVPLVVSAIIERLCAKMPEERYQTAAGLHKDFVRCRELLQMGDGVHIPDFPLGTDDVSGRLNIPQKLYGRDDELRRMLDAFARTVEGECIVLTVSGAPGIGKTSLVHEVQQPIVEQRGYFISGKYDQYKRDLPYAAILDAFRDLARQIAAESDAVVRAWRERVNAALGDNAAVLIDVVPELAPLLGSTQTFLELSGEEAQNRFHNTFQDFLRVVTEAAPLVMFLDDLQRADGASLGLLETISADTRIRRLLLLVAYRDGEVDPGGPVAGTLRKIRESATPTDHIHLDHLKAEHVHALVRETLGLKPAGAGEPERGDEIRDLSDFIVERTAGNPFFVNEFLRNLDKEAILFFDQDRARWNWDGDRLRNVDYSRNVVEFMAARMLKLSPAAQALLQLGACIGGEFDLKTLLMVRGNQGLPIVEQGLWEALEAGLILPMNEDYQLVRAFDTALEDGNRALDIGYRFLHDRVQQAAYSLIPETDRPAMHASIGRHLRAQLDHAADDAARAARIIQIVNHLNQALELITDPTERIELCRLNLEAGRKARAAVAYEPALSYLLQALQLLPADPWGRYYDLSLAVHTAAAEMAYTQRDFEYAGEISDLVLANSRNVVDRVPVYKMRIRLSTSENNMKRAVELGLELLGLFGIRFPAKTRLPHVIRAFMRTQIALIGKSEEDLLGAERVRNPEDEAILLIYHQIMDAAFFATPELLPVLVLRMTTYTATRGNSPVSPIAFAMFGLALCGPLNNVSSGYYYGGIAVRLVDRLNAREARGRTVFLYNHFIRHWKEPIRAVVEPLREALRYNFEGGDLQASSYCLQSEYFHILLSGANLQTLYRDREKWRGEMREFRQTQSQPMIDIWCQLTANLAGHSNDPHDMNGEFFNEAETLPVMLAMNHQTVLAYIYFARIMLGTIFGYHAAAVNHFEEGERFIESNAGSTVYSFAQFYVALSSLALVPDCSGPERRRHLRRAGKAEKLLKNWAHHAPVNYAHKYLLVQAERARVTKRRQQADRLYESAIAAAQAAGCVQDEALAAELAAAAHIASDRKRLARTYLTDAVSAYRRWGASARVRELMQNYASLLSGEFLHLSGRVQTRDASKHEGGVTGDVSEHDSSTLDLMTLMKAAQTVSSEIHLPNLLERMLKLLRSNAGAEQVLFILNEDGRLMVEAVCDAEVVRLPRLPLEEYPDAPHTVLNYTARTGESLAANDAVKEGFYAGDPYIRDKQPRSVLCLPIMQRGILLGVLYFDNRLVADLYSDERRLELLQLLCSQTAVPLENAVLYRSMEERLKERTAELQQAHDQLLILERDVTERQMAGGFAHEMRNALSGSSILLEEALGRESSHARSVTETTAERLRETYILLSEHLQGEVLQRAQNLIRESMENEKHLDELLRILQRSTSRGLEITRQILSYSRVGEESGIEDVDLARVFQDILTEIRAKYPAIRTRVDVPPELPPVPGNLRHYYSVFQNLVLNACEALQEKSFGDGDFPWIEVTASHAREGANDCIVVSVADNGPGISAENRKRIFEPFFSTKPETGTGLGLGIVKKVLSIYKGEIHLVEDRPGGAECRLKLRTAALPTESF